MSTDYLIALSCFQYQFLFLPLICNQKLTVGGTAEKIVSAFHLVVSEHSTEDEEMSKCKSAVHHVRKMEKDVDVALAKGNLVLYWNAKLRYLHGLLVISTMNFVHLNICKKGR